MTCHLDDAVESLFATGMQQMTEGDARAAEASFLEVLRLAPDTAEAHTNLALLLEKAGRVAEAEQHIRHALNLNPRSWRTHLNLAALLLVQKRFAEAQAASRRSLALAPESPEAWSNLGALQACLKQEAHAERSYRRAMELDPDHKASRFNLSYLLLRQGRFEEGWQCLEARTWYGWMESLLPCPRWQGEALTGRSLLITFEAGHGDMIQFARYAALLKGAGAVHITMVCHPALKSLFQALDGVDAVFAFDETFPATGLDFWTPPLSIPYYLGTRLDTIPANIPYLRAPGDQADRWAQELAALSPGREARVGLVWKGSPSFENDADRSLPGLASLEGLGRVAGVRFFSLQKGAGEQEASDPPAGLCITDLAPGISDFAGAAAIVANLDLVIAVDTAFAHLAGALGTPCWVLLPEYKTDWRWLTGRGDSPWYPGVMRLFRQLRPGDWGAVLDEVRDALESFAAGLRGADYLAVREG
ncbi:hypothetical protein GMST_13830 [Geomonas silvestris]|uniref:Uncharacterized protein n=1 Tax=Geomonas silvestris TaxID=2740184 RepID=A0A6V8MGE3_9BACT|nr:tetratricopeptide repeat protein [Geomonas silvestris]GFO59058.1 hypothetical protein GMST_13830 [Geomonas silvestris]